MKAHTPQGGLTAVTLLEVVKTDHRLNCYHISLYTALLYYSRGMARLPFQVSRRKLMEFSRIKSAATYHKCLKELTRYQYISYFPSFHPHLGSRIVLSGQTVSRDD